MENTIIMEKEELEEIFLNLFSTKQYGNLEKL